MSAGRGQNPRPHPLSAGAFFLTRLPFPIQTAGEPLRFSDQMKLTVLERHGERFKARFRVNSTTIRVIHGHIKGRQIWWSRKDVTPEKGKGRGGDNFGYISGKQIRMRFRTTVQGKEHLGLLEFRLVPAK